MRDDDVLTDDELRFVDVLLEEHFAAAPRVCEPAPPQRPSMAWLAAALLGIGVLAGTWWLRHESAAPAQEPEPRSTTPFVPRSDDELRAFLEQVVEVQARSGLSFAAAPMGVERSSGIRLRITDPGRLRAMCAGWTPRGSRADHPPDVLAVHLVLTARDGRQVECSAGGREVDAGGTCYVGQQCWHAPGIRGQELLDDALEQVVATPAALRDQPATRANLDCAALTAADLQAELPRFQELRRLVVIFDDRTAAVVAAQPSLEELEVVIPSAAAGLGAAGWKQLATLPHLRRLCLAGDVAAVEPSHLVGLRTLQEVDIPGDLELPWSGPGLLTAIAGLPAVVELRIAVRWPTQSANSAGAADVSAVVAAMPCLRRLALCTDAPPQPLLMLLKDTQLAKLHLAGFELDAGTLDALAAAKALHELDLRGARFTDEATGRLATLRQLTRLDLRGVLLGAEQLSTLQEALPSCQVLTTPGTTAAMYPPLGDASSWSDDR